MENPLEVYIATLSDQDRVRFRDLIEDARRRHNANKEMIAQIREDLENLSRSWTDLQELSKSLLDSLEDLNGAIRDLNDSVVSELTPELRSSQNCTGRSWN